MLKVQGYPTAFFWKQAKALDVPLLPSSTTAHHEHSHPLRQSRSHFSIIMAWHFLPSALSCVTHHQGTTGTPPHAKAMACSAENFSFNSAGSTRLPQSYQGPREESQGAAGHLVRCFNALSSSDETPCDILTTMATCPALWLHSPAWKERNLFTRSLCYSYPVKAELHMLRIQSCYYSNVFVCEQQLPQGFYSN